MLYGEELHVVEAANSDSGTMTAINLTAALAAENLAKTMWLPGVVRAFGYRCVTAFTLGSTPTPPVFELYKYPNGLVADDLATAIEMYNDLVVKMNAHALDTTMHTVAPDNVNFTAALTPQTPVTGLAGLLVGINLLQTAFAAHNVDAIAGSPSYHTAQNSSSLALADATPSTTLALAIGKINDMMVKFNKHDLYLTCHAVVNLHQSYRVSLGTIKLLDGYLPGKVYRVKVPNTVIDQVPVQSGKAQFNAGDSLVLVTTTLGIGGTKAGTLQPFIIYSNRGENDANQEQIVDLTPAIVGI